MPVSSFSFPTYYPDAGTGFEDSNRTYVGPLAQPLFKQTSQPITLLHMLSPLIPSFAPPCRMPRPSLETYTDMRLAHGSYTTLLAIGSNLTLAEPPRPTDSCAGLPVLPARLPHLSHPIC